MDEPGPGVRPQTLALDTLIRETVSRTRAGTDNAQVDTMLFLGNRHQSFPVLVVRDPVLEPVDKLVWMVIMLAVSRTASAITFPSYDVIGRMANVSSRSTIARAIAILRATRWLTLCARVRDAAGQFLGNVYALHDEPLPLADALHLDSGYMAFLGHSQTHGHARVRAVAKGVLDSMDEDIRAGLDVIAREHPLEHRTRTMAMTEERGGPRRYFAFTENTVRQLWNKPGSKPPQVWDHDQNSNPGHSSGSCINKTTTTQDRIELKSTLTAEDGRALVYPRRLVSNQREVADRYLRRIAAVHRQPVLDELEGRCRAEQKGMAPLYDELSFLHALCRAVRDGKFHPNLGIRVRNERIERDRSRWSSDGTSESPARESEAQRTERMVRHRRKIAELKELVGLHTATEKQGATSESSSG
ncbi:MAG: STY4528 family pathogenicity island replication protein [Gammaproteobacteria bacterium]|nr:STY4528 family pathogenicity island replication protein [Gammaproteobacteria bacterium]MDE0411063.1 STY4528 family pathogenicity island replication protein [Gammaproteobacteria bacterium]